MWENICFHPYLYAFRFILAVMSAISTASLFTDAMLPTAAAAKVTASIVTLQWVFGLSRRVFRVYKSRSTVLQSQANHLVF